MCKFTRIFPTLMLALFFALIFSKATGSSLSLLALSKGELPSPLVKSSGSSSQIWSGQLREIRSDEWAVITAMALGQKNHRPPFPIINNNLGIEGHNMLIVGMSGVPVWHVSTLAKPATWGFFLFPIPVALSWYWHFPFFSCLLSLFFIFNKIAPRNPVGNAGLSLIFCLSPYAAGWSNWPLYAVFFPSAMTLVFLGMLTQKSLQRIFCQALLLGLLAAGFFFILYPPWQIALATFFLLFNIGYALDNKDKLEINRLLFLAVAFSVFIFLAIIWGWWSDTEKAVRTISATVYPGHRAVLHGADTPFKLLFFGYSNLLTLPALKNSAFNESEFSSFFYLFPAIFYLLFRHLISGGNKKWTAGMIFGFLSAFILYAAIGFPAWVAQLLLWNHVPVHRGQLALGLACIFAVAICLNFNGKFIKFAQKRSILLITFLTIMLVIYGITSIPEAFFPQNSLSFTFFMAAVGGLMCILLLREKFLTYILVNIFIYFFSVWSFNPISVASENILLTESTQKFLAQAKNTNHLDNQRVLIINSDIKKSMGLVAAGVPVVNATFYYPQFKFWKNIGLPDKDMEVINRYQHLLVRTTEFNDATKMNVQKLTVDSLLLSLDAKKFNFSNTGASVIADGKMDTALRENAGLFFLGQQDGWNWYAVHPGSAL